MYSELPVSALGWEMQALGPREDSGGVLGSVGGGGR